MGKILKISKHSVLKFALLMSFKGLLCFRNCEGCVTGEVYARKNMDNYNLCSYPQRQDPGHTLTDGK